MNVLLNRNHFALGDWIMFADLIHNFTRAWPDMNIDVEATLPDMSEVLRICGVRFRLVEHPDTSKYDGVVPHVAYTTVPTVIRGQHLLVNMCKNVCDQLKLDIHELGHLDLVHCVVPSEIQCPESPYVLVPGKEDIKRISLDKAYTEWDDLVSRLSKFWRVYELNTNLSPEKAYKDSSGIIRTNSLPDTARLLRNAFFTVCTENGLNHWACHNGGKTFCIMKSSQRRATPKELFYRSMTPITLYGEMGDSPDYVFQKIAEGVWK